jgi:hypothetical protein
MSKYLKFEQSKFKTLDEKILFLFHSQTVDIKNRSSPLEKVH